LEKPIGRRKQGMERNRERVEEGTLRMRKENIRKKDKSDEKERG